MGKLYHTEAAKTHLPGGLVMRGSAYGQVGKKLRMNMKLT